MTNPFDMLTKKPAKKEQRRPRVKQSVNHPFRTGYVSRNKFNFLKSSEVDKSS